MTDLTALPGSASFANFAEANPETMPNSRRSVGRNKSKVKSPKIAKSGQRNNGTMRPPTPLTSALLLAAAASVSPAAADVLSLTDDNYERLTAGKPVFIKFFAPCKYSTLASYM